MHIIFGFHIFVIIWSFLIFVTLHNPSLISREEFIPNLICLFAAAALRKNIFLESEVFAKVGAKQNWCWVCH